MSNVNDIDDSDAGYLTDTSQVYHGIAERSNSLKNDSKRIFTEEESETKRVTANSQERCRMQKLNYALDRLRRCLPPQLQVCQRRLSKIRTLKLATNYISTLAEILDEHCASQYCSAQRRTLGMDPRFAAKNNVHRDDDANVILMPEKHEYFFKSSESQCLTPLACQYGYRDSIPVMSGGTTEASNFGVTTSSPTLPASVYNQEMRRDRNIFPSQNISKDEFGHEFSQPIFPWYHRGVFVTNSSNTIKQQ